MLKKYDKNRHVSWMYKLKAKVKIKIKLQIFLYLLFIEISAQKSNTYTVYMQL